MKGLSVPQFPRLMAPVASTRELLLCTTFPHSYCAVHSKSTFPFPPLSLSLLLSVSLSASTATGLSFHSRNPRELEGHVHTHSAEQYYFANCLFAFDQRAFETLMQIC